MSLQWGAHLNGAPSRQQRRAAARQEQKPQRRAGAISDLDHLLGQAVAQQKAGRPGEAIELYSEVLTRQPDHVDALNFAGVAAFQIGDRELALSLLQAAVARKPDYAEAHANLGNVLAVAGFTDQAVAAHRRAIEIEPNHATAHYNLGTIFQATGRFEDSAAAYRAAIALRPGHVEAHTDLAAVLCKIGDLDGAEAACWQALKLRPNDAAAHTNLALALRAGGARDEAAAMLRRVLALNPTCGTAHNNLGHILFHEDDPEPAARCFAEALRTDPTLAMAHFYLGVIRDLQGETAAAADQFAALARNPKATDYLIESWDYVKSNTGVATRLFSDTFETLQYALECAQVDGLVLEFGVRFGTSLNFLSGRTDQEVHGFDSFQGLPEAWDGFAPGLYATGGKLPEAAANVRLHVGLFGDTLPRFAAEHGGPIRFMNVDCDLYSSTRTVFDHLAGRIVPGTVIVFDEYLVNPSWREDEFKAFQEAVRQYAWRYEYLAFNIFSKQAVVRIL